MKLSILDNINMQGELVIRTYNSKTGKLLRKSKAMKNLIVSSNTYGKNIIARQLIGDTTYPLEIDSAKIGTGTTTPALSDTDLQTAVLSGILVADASVANNIATIDFFMTDSELTNGTYTEFGMFMNSRILTRILFASSYTIIYGVGKLEYQGGAGPSTWGYNGNIVTKERAFI